MASFSLGNFNGLLRTDAILRSEKTFISGSIMLTGFLISVAFFYIQGVVLGRPYPHNTFLFMPTDHMADWGGAFQFVWDLDPFHSLYRGQGNNYPPVGYLISVPFTILGFELGKVVFASVFSFAWLWFCWKYIAKSSSSTGLRYWTTAIFGLMNYSYLFALDRMNAENSLFLLVLAFYVAFREGKTRSSAAFLGVAAAAKIYPGFGAVLFLQRRSYKPLVYFLGAAVVSTAAALIIFRTTPLEALEAYRISAPSFRATIGDTSMIQNSASWFVLVRLYQLFCLGYDRFSPEQSVPLVEHALRSFSVFLILPLCVLVFSSLSRKLVKWELLTMAVSAMLLFTPVSFDYKLLYLIFPFASFLDAPTGRRTTLAFSIFFGLLFTPKSFFIVINNVTSNVVLNVVILTIMFVWIAVRAFCGPMNLEPAAAPRPSTTSL